MALNSTNQPISNKDLMGPAITVLKVITNYEILLDALNMNNF